MVKRALPVAPLCFMILLVVGVVWAMEDPLVLENKYGGVAFSHQKHADKKCQDCHHTLKEGTKARRNAVSATMKA